MNGKEGPPAATGHVGVVAAGLAWLFGLAHLAWAAGVPVFGGTREQLDEIGRTSAKHLIPEITIGTVALAGGLLALALVRPWGSALPRRLLRLMAWAGVAAAVPAAVYGIAYLVLQSLAAAGRYEFPAAHNATAAGWWFFWGALFTASGGTFTATVWLTRRRRRPLADPDRHPVGPEHRGDTA